MSGSVVHFTNLVTSEHADKPNYMAMVAAAAQPDADLIALYASVASLYNLNSAVGAQLDVIGQIVGVTRNISTILTGVYFSLDILGLGLDQSNWQGPTDPTSGTVTLTDANFLLLIKARILANYWNGSIPAAYVLANEVYTAYGYQLFIQDYGNLSMAMGLVCDILDALVNVVESTSTQVTAYNPSTSGQDNLVAAIGVQGIPPPEIIALLANGYLDMKPASIGIDGYYWPSAPGQMFSLDLNNTWFAGLDQGILAAESHRAAPIPNYIFALDVYTLNAAGLDLGSWKYP